MTTYSIYHPGETYKCQSLVYNGSILVDPAAITCEILDPAGNSRVTDDMRKMGIGTYTYNYDLPADATLGKWTAVIKATDGSNNVEIDTVHFLVDSKQGTTIE